MKPTELKELIKKAVEQTKPDIRGFYRVVRKGRIVKSYASNGSYWADVQPCRNDESDDPDEPVIPKVEIPVMWAGPQRGMVCPPQPGTFCDLEYYDGDPNYPRISNFRWHNMAAPNCELDELIIQQTPGNHIRMMANGDIEIYTARKIRIKGSRIDLN